MPRRPTGGPSPSPSLSAASDEPARRRTSAREARIDRDSQHRVRNVLAVVRSVLRRTVAVGGSGEHMIDHFSGRLDALARAHQACVVSNSGCIDLEELIRGELHAFRFGDDPRIKIDGPAVAIGLETGQTLGLAFHEMVTNSFKFGALSGDRSAAQVAVAWSLDGDRLRIGWVESNVAVVAKAPRRHGFGREFIEHAVPYQLGGAVRVDLEPGGMIYNLSLPLPLTGSQTGEDGHGWT